MVESNSLLFKLYLFILTRRQFTTRLGGHMFPPDPVIIWPRILSIFTAAGLFF